jgi:hypothetical protein
MVLLSVLVTIKHLLENLSPDDSFYGHEASDVLPIIDAGISYFGDKSANEYPDTLEAIFGPTASLQEISMSNGWGKVYLMLSESFDKTIYSIHAEI